MLNGELTFETYDLLILDSSAFFKSGVPVASRFDVVKELHQRFDLRVWEEKKFMNYLRNKRYRKIFNFAEMEYLKYFSIPRKDLSNYLRVNGSKIVTKDNDLIKALGHLAIDSFSLNGILNRFHK